MLLLSYHFPPSRAAGALRWQKLTKYAADYGWGVDAITLTPADLATADQETLADLPRGTRVFGVHEVGAPWESLEHAAWKAWKRYRGAGTGNRQGSALPPPAGSRAAAESFARGELQRFPRTWRDWRRAYHTWTHLWREREWARQADSVALRVYDDASHRAVVSCGPPHLVHTAARWLASRTGLPFVMDLRDPWSLVERLHEALASPVWYRVAEANERRCVQQASLVVMNTEAARAAMAARYQDVSGRIAAVMNGCDDEPIGEFPASTTFRIVYAGSVYLDRDPRALLRAAGAVVRALSLAPSQFSVEFIGDANASYCGVAVKTLASEQGLADYVRIHGPVPRQRLLEMLSGAAVLVSLPQDSHLAIPSKVFEYMSFPARILAFATPESATGALLQGTEADVVLPGDVEGTAAVLNRRYLEHRAGVRPLPIGSQARFTRRYQAEILFQMLDRLVNSTAGTETGTPAIRGEPVAEGSWRST